MSPAHALIADFLAGRREALGQLDAWILPVIHHRTWRLGDQEEDLLQEIRLKLLHLFESGAFRGESSLKSYVQATAQYTCLDAVRRARVRRSEELKEELLPASRDNPSEELERRDSARICYRVLAALPEGCRRMFQLLLVHELSYEQIATELALKLGTVRSRLARCRDRAVVLRHRMLSGAAAEAQDPSEESG